MSLVLLPMFYINKTSHTKKIFSHEPLFKIMLGENSQMLFSKGVLGVHSLLTQEQSSSSESGQIKESLRDLDEKKGLSNL